MVREPGDGWQAALNRWLDEKDAILAGRDPRAPEPAGYTLGRLCNEYLTAKLHALRQGKIVARHFDNLTGSCKRLVDHFGGGRLAADIGPDDFERFGFSFPVTWRLRRRRLEINAVRSIFRYGFDKEKLPRLRFGTFKAPGRDELDAERFARERKHGTREFTPDQLRKIIDAAPVPLRAMILLAVNCGYGNSDVATLPLSYLDLEGGWANYPRPRTSIKRRAKLWPETVAALREAIVQRPRPQRDADEALAFLSPTGKRWVDATVENGDGAAVEVKATDRVGKTFTALLERLGMQRPGLSYYSLRHCTETHGGADQVAVDAVMGHRTPGMGTNYRQSIADDRLEAVADPIHAWLYGK